MKPTTLRQIYIYSTLIISLLVILPINYIMNWSLEWYYAILLFFLFRLIGSFLYTYFSGINVSKIEFIELEDNVQYFSILFVVRNKRLLLYGEFKNSLSLNNEDLRYLIDRQTSSKMFFPVLKDGQSTEIMYDYHGKNLIVKFKIYE